MSGTAGRARRWMLAALLGLLAATTAAAGVEWFLERRDERRMPTSGELVDVGGRRIHVECHGIGSPTVVLVPGAGEPAAVWGWVAPMVAGVTRVCVYDRAGRGRSDDAAAPQDGLALAHDLHQAIAAEGPVVLVGHSVGGLHARIHAAAYPGDVAGVVLLDATHPDMFARVGAYPATYRAFATLSKAFPALATLGIGRIAYRSDFDSLPPAARDVQRALWSTARQARSQRDEWAMLPTVMRQARGTSLGSRPLSIVTAGRDAQPEWPALQAELARLSANSVRHVIAGASHMALVDTKAGAAASATAILEVVAAVRTGHPVGTP